MLDTSIIFFRAKTMSGFELCLWVIASLGSELVVVININLSKTIKYSLNTNTRKE